MENDDEAGRSMHLIGGRRVSVSDLVDAGLVPAGAKLRFTRKRIGRTYEASVTDRGRIRLEPGGEEFRTPSRAAAVAAGMRAVDGWLAWVVVDQDRLLDAARQELLDQEIAKVTAAVDRQAKDATQQRVHERLRQARRRADQQDPERITVRDLLAFWGATDRGDQVSLIEADLANHGLVTSPSFRAVTLDTTVSLTTPPDETDETTTVESAVQADPAAEDDEGGGDLDVGLKVGNLSPLRGVMSVDPNSSIGEAITKMLIDDYSQLAVLSGPRNLRGAVTWRSIAQAVQLSPDASVAEAIEPHVDVVPYERDLFEVLPALQQRGFVFVQNESKEIAGIVTMADVAQHYGDMATPFLQLGELDQTLRWILGRTFDIKAVQQLCNKTTITSFDDLAFGDYQRVLENKDAWDTLGWPVDRATFISRLEAIRLIRNKVMHFHPDPVPEDAVDQLRRFNALLHKYRNPA
ncbi:CBS domain-containing protein [Actinophytocola oryzae]|uniref:restriction system modified-DNA reader domain-containing protein n=1 Tax=Actinophytocola oryzae TaxID=502181 RepID=UPI001FB88330|nr:CBS domain-containing protein [Actinophytocola oryzae]